MRVWAFTMAMFLGLVMWGVDVLDRDAAGVGDNGLVRSMDGPLWPPKP